MKNLTRRTITIYSILCLALSFSFAQENMLTGEAQLVGSSSDLNIGLHSGIFDCNQDLKYPFNVGLQAQYIYTPNVSKMWFLGGELGGFYTQNSLDGNNREMGALIGHISIFPGISFDLNKKEYPETTDFESSMKTSKIKLAAGLTFGTPLKTYSDGTTYHEDNASSGIGFTAMVMYEMPGGLSIFLSGTRVGADMDGFGFDPATGDMTPGNEHNQSLWYKLGLAYNFLK